MSQETENIERTTAEYKNLSEKFTTQCADYNRQYCSIYLARLKEMEALLMERITKKWGDRFPICKLHKLAEVSYDKCVVIGTIFKDQKLKPSILKQLAEANQLTPQPVLHHFTDETDRLFLEDELQRYQLLGTLDVKKLVTGVTCALLGSDMGNGKFMVEDCVFADCRPQIEKPIFNEDVFVVFVSAMNFIKHENFISNLELFAYWLCGMVGDGDTVSRIARIVIAGNSIKTTTEKHIPTISLTSRVTESTETIEAVKSFDYFLLQLSELVDVDVMPGEHDPSNHILPQKPMHYCMFPKSSVYKSLNQVSNPYFFSLDGLKIFGTSGQPVRDIKWFSEVTDPLDALESCLKWNHIAPTAPDTLGCFPYYEKDPFILDDCPHVFFAGNQEEFGTRMVTGSDGQKIRLISIPEFCNTFQAVMLNLKDLGCDTIDFDTSK
ncbi:hypothetical protein NQ315_016157 [Exocentrus adspersus]|uniref:DNA polymerase delta small subunit n=1 Tax=Exocentrus adspersus TaxID=1586481 RepID=A0AAV8VG51_9CUCU|nr:hypothetical protein NQ315_016157 [Exocentrus adspersus]